MAEAAVLNAPVDAGAGVVDSGGGGGAPAVVETPSAPQSDEQILGIEDVGIQPAVEEPAAPAVVDPAAKPADGAAKTPEQVAAESIAEDGRLMPVKWREMAKSDPEFRKLFYEGKANSEKLATIEPQFTKMQETVAAVEKTDAAFLSGDPVSIQSELKNFVASKPEAMIPMIQAGENLLKETNPAEYQRISAERFTESLTSNNFGAAFKTLREALEAGPDGAELLSSQVGKILEWAEKNGFPTTEAGRLAAQKSQLDARDATHRAQDEQNYNKTAKTFSESVNTEMEKSIKGEITSTLTKLLEKSAFPEGARARIAAESYTEIQKLLSQNSAITDRIGKLIWPNGSRNKEGIVRGNFNDANRVAAIAAPVEYAKTVLNDVLKRVVEGYTKDFIATNDTKEKKLAAAASRTDVSGGTPREQPRKKLSTKDTAGLTEEQILDLE